ncbi:MAG: CoA transferase [Bacteroidales bacterium]|nr:CoA transferase [Bacteroidales bacterium]MBN2758634.1 CoA transferase [Bacteroidales bacterium]
MPTINQLVESIPNRFKPEKSKDLETIINFDIKGFEKGIFNVKIENENCFVIYGFSENAKCNLKLSEKNYILLETGKLKPQTAVLTGKLKVSNINEMLKFSKCFGRYKETKPDEQKIMYRPEKNGPLKGVKIVDLTRLVPGPLATMYLAQMGADVIKVEDEDFPDYIRDYPPDFNGQSAYYQVLNKSKRSLTINMHSNEGKEILKKLVKVSDVIIEQFRPGIMDKMGFSFEELKKINPKIIYISLTGYGQTGNYSNTAGHDLNFIATSGILNLIRDETNKPIIPNFQIGDIAGGSYMLITAVTTALYQREKNKQAQKIDVSMLDSILPLMSLSVAEHVANNLPETGAAKTELSGKLANYNIYQCADNKWIALAALEPKFWNIFCDIVQKPNWKEWILPEISEKNNLKNHLEELFKSKDSEYWVILTENTDSCVSPVNSYDDIFNNTHIKQRESIITDLKTGLKTFSFPIKFSESTTNNIWEAPNLGEDNEQILSEIDL